MIGVGSDILVPDGLLERLEQLARLTPFCSGHVCQSDSAH